MPRSFQAVSAYDPDVVVAGVLRATLAEAVSVLLLVLVPLEPPPPQADRSADNAVKNAIPLIELFMFFLLLSAATVGLRLRLGHPHT
jgi:hypothetical protein